MYYADDDYDYDDDLLLPFQVPVIENSVCQEMFNTGGHNKKILNSFLCAGYATGLKDSCEVCNFVHTLKTNEINVVSFVG